MNTVEITKTINFIRPNAKFSVDDEKVIWLDEEQKKPTAKEIEDGWLNYQNFMAKSEKDALEKKTALLEKLGITEQEINLLFG